MADITAGLPTLRPEEELARQDRARLAALGAPVARGALDLGTLLPRALVGAGNFLVRGANALGAELPMQRLPGDSPNALPQFQLAPYSAAAATQPEGSWGPAMTAPAPTKSGTSVVSFEPAFAPAPVQAAPAPGTPTPQRGAKNPAGMPAGAPAPLVPAAPVGLIPGETGFYHNNTLVPYGAREDEIAAYRAVGQQKIYTQGMLDSLPGGGRVGPGGFADPRDTMVFNALHPAFLNLEGDKLKANAAAEGQRIGAGATMGAARLRADVDREQLAEVKYARDITPFPVGQTTIPSPTPGLPPTIETSYAIPAPRTEPGGMPRVLNSAKPKPTYVDGTRVKLKDGRMATITNGQPVPDK